MAVGVSAPIARRRSLAGQSGWAGLVHNRKVFAIAVFASLGGLLYGQHYPPQVCKFPTNSTVPMCCRL